MSEVAKKLSVDKIYTYVELHSKGQSKMNQGWSFHDLYLFKEGNSVMYFLEHFIKTKINTKNYNCYENNDMNQKTCLDDFYMNKLNCTFPWIKSKDNSQQKCGSQDYIKDLVNLIDDVVKGE